MRKFLFKIFIFALILVSAISFVLLQYGGYLDYFYEKFTVPKQSSLILGDSRSFQGIQPRIIDKEMKGKFQIPMFNYSFTIAQIAYGEPYTKSVLKKLNHETRNGLFILSVHPWLLSERENDDLKKGVYGEEDAPPHNMLFTEMSPNFEYFFRNLTYFHFKSIFSRTSKLHKDGWLEESNLPKDSSVFKSWRQNQLNIYTDFSEKWKKSEIRKVQLVILIDSLKKYGKVFLIRMPVHKEMQNLENRYWGNFDYEIQEISRKEKISYINFFKDTRYRTYDGNHIDKYGGIFFTKTLCDSINKYH